MTGQVRIALAAVGAACVVFFTPTRSVRAVLAMGIAPGLFTSGAFRVFCEITGGKLPG